MEGRGGMREYSDWDPAAAAADVYDQRPRSPGTYL